MKHLIVFLLCCCSLLVYAQEKREEVAVSDSILLQEVMVKADKKLITLKSDRYVVDATQIRNGKNTLKEVLRDVPGVIVNKENVSIIGKGGLKVMINGRLKQIPDNQISNLLSSYSASEIKKIEVIYHTGAEYDASGNSGWNKVRHIIQFGSTTAKIEIFVILIAQHGIHRVDSLIKKH